MITGYNTDIRHNERVFHLQTEDKGIDNPVIESLIYMGGKIVASRQYCYAALLRDGYDEKAVQDVLDNQHRKMIRDIKGGKFDPEGPPPFGAGIITDRSFDELVLEFVASQAATESLELVVNQDASPRAGAMVELDLLARTEVRNVPVAGARIVVKARPAGGGDSVLLLEGATDGTGRLQAGVDLAPDLAGGALTIEAAGSIGSDEVTLEIAGP